MPILLIFAFISGLITILAPCIWPILPIIFSSTATFGRAKSLGIALGVAFSFAFFTLTLSYLVSLFKFDPDILRTLAVVILTILGLSLIFSKFSGLMEVLFGKLTGFIKVKPGAKDSGFLSGLITGFSLGIVWSPCAGPILSTIATLASTRAVNFGIVLVTLSYVSGVFIVLLLFSLGGNAIFARSRFLNKYLGTIQKVFGVVIILTAISIFTNFDRTLQVKLLDAIPAYSSFLYKIESIKPVDQALDNLNKDGKKPDNSGKPFNQISDMGSKLPVFRKAPEFAGIFHWLNIDKPLTMKELRGKVVLIDFWTYTCINCIRTLPYVTGWHEKYKDKNFTVIGVHSPEFEFEKKTANVEMAIKQYKITYPVAQDNDFLTWKAYSNRYWPAKYLIDADGNLRKYHFGEGGYEEMEAAIRELIEEAGGKIDEKETDVISSSPAGKATPESYLGFDRMERFFSKEKIALGEKTYSLKPQIPLNYLAFEGRWLTDHEFSQSFKGSKLHLNFTGEKVFLVIHPFNSPEGELKGKPSDKVRVFLDDKFDKEIEVTEPKLYEIIDLQGTRGEHLLRLEFLNNGTKVFAFTFG